MLADALFISDFRRVNCAAENKVLSGHLEQLLESRIRSAGIPSDRVQLISIHTAVPGGKDVERVLAEDRARDLERLGELLRAHPARVLVPLGDYALRVVTGLESIQKWNCSVVKAKAEYGGRKCVPLYHPEQVMKDFSLTAMMGLGCQKVAAEMQHKELRIPERSFLLNPSYEKTMHLLSDLAERAEPLAVDIETGQGLINTVGFAWSATEAIAIKTLPEDYTPDQFHKLWLAIAKVLEGPRPKLLQNFIYEATWFARYGIEIKSVAFDTMWAMKFLHPELDKGLDNVGRFYTPYPYWKDDNDSWNNIKDWPRHFDYNCKDTTGTFAAYQAQSDALRGRGLDSLFNGFVMRFAPVIQEMCTRGLLLDPVSLINLKEKLQSEAEGFQTVFDRECKARLGRKVNSRSPKQLKEALKSLGMKIPVQRGKESADKKALIKLRKKHPGDPVLSSLIGLSSKNKQLSSYVNFDYDRKTNRVHYSLDGCGTETGRWSGSLSGWGEGFNPQTVPKLIRNCFIAEPGKKLIQIDLAQAESRYVAWEAPEPKLMQMLQEGRDVHKYVAAQIFKKPEHIVNRAERQLGKKAGHAANYCVGPKTFAESCLVEMNLPMEDREAKRILASYFEVFPGILKRQRNIQQLLRNRRKLTTPLGRERHFYGRMDDATFREAYAYTPQSTVPDIINHLMLKLWDEREFFDVEFLLQMHDSVLLQAPIGRVDEIAEFARDSSAWHPRIILPGGILVIPADIEVGDRWGMMERI